MRRPVLHAEQRVHPDESEAADRPYEGPFGERPPPTGRPSRQAAGPENRPQPHVPLATAPPSGPARLVGYARRTTVASPPPRVPWPSPAHIWTTVSGAWTWDGADEYAVGR